jgi:hypothetical protein
MSKNQYEALINKQLAVGASLLPLLLDSSRGMPLRSQFYFIQYSPELIGWRRLQQLVSTLDSCGPSSLQTWRISQGLGVTGRLLLDTYTGINELHLSACAVHLVVLTGV